MSLDTVPWFVDGAAHGAEVARLLSYVAAGDSEGIVSSADMFVHPTAVPGDNVTVDQGSGILLNKYAFGFEQSYLVRNGTTTDVEISPTGSGGGRSDMLVVRIDDPQYGGTVPEDIENGPYAKFEVIQNVSATAIDIPAGHNYPAIPLCRIDIPASTGTITSGMIVDIRRLASPKITTVVRPNATVTAETETLNATGTDGEYFPNAGGVQDIYIPTWATRMQIRADWLMVKYPGGNRAGWCFVDIGTDNSWRTQAFTWDTSNLADTMRTSWTVVDDLYIPPEKRGTTQRFIMKGRLGSGTTTVKPTIDASSGTSLEVRFLEQPDSSTS